MPLKALDRWLFQPENRIAALWLRFAFGIFLCAYFLTTAASQAAVDPYLFPVDAYRMFRGGEVWWNPLAQDWSSDWAWIFVGLGALSSLCFALGLFPRACGVLNLLLVFWFYDRDPFYAKGADSVLRPITLFAIFLPSRLGETRGLWALRAIQVSECMIYFTTALNKWFFSAEWRDGSAFKWMVYGSAYMRGFDPSLIEAVPAALIIFLSYLTLLFQGGFPLLIWWEKARRPVLAAALVVNIGMQVILKPGAWPILMVIYSISFLRDREFRSYTPPQEWLRNFVHNGRVFRRISAYFPLSSRR